jgi:hypothetical protein
MNALKEMSRAKKAVTTPLDDFDLIESLPKPTVMSPDKIISNFIFACHQGFGESIEAANRTALDSAHPGIE